MIKQVTIVSIYIKDENIIKTSEVFMLGRMTQFMCVMDIVIRLKYVYASITLWVGDHLLLTRDGVEGDVEVASGCTQYIIVHNT